ncbi:MAG TPA: serine/threonine-protein kinase [Streptosporangiaceae bacterium]
MRTPVSDPLRIGPYQVLGRLGSGGMGWVYFGRSPGGRAVAVKVVRPEYAADPDFRRRFAREVTAARAVSGAYTAEVVDADTDGDPPWLATVYVAGPSLQEAIKEHGPLSEPEVRLLGVRLVRALQAIHSAGVVHRDLKPSNVLLAEDGPRVIDFGISLVAGTTTLTGTGVVMGTPSYMAPEQVRAARVGPAGDVFSLGGVLAFAATGESPFGGGSDVFYRIVHEEPTLGAAPAGLREVLARCLDKDPARRQSLPALLAELAGRAGHAGPAGRMAASPWPRAVAENIHQHAAEAAARRSGTGGRGMAMRSNLLLHAQTLLEAGLTDELVVEAVARARA